MAARHLSNAAACCSHPFTQRTNIGRTIHNHRCYASIREVHDQLAAGTTVTSIVERYLQTARDTQHLGSFLHLAEEHAMQQVCHHAPYQGDTHTTPRHGTWTHG